MSTQSRKQTLGSCPFTIRPLEPGTYLIHENDSHQEHPHIYAKICSREVDDGDKASVIVLSDTGVGTEAVDGAQHWTLWTFLESTINPGCQIPYLVVLTHCHYDHILGLKHLALAEHQHQNNMHVQRQPHVTIAASSHEPSFVTPYETLAEHSLCKDQGVDTPIYKIDMWCDDRQRLEYDHPSGSSIPVGVIIFHTPGHTPDSMSWYDEDNKVLYVGDSLYQQESSETREAPWGPEQPMSIIFPKEGSLVDWWSSVKNLIAFVEAGNGAGQSERHIKLAAGHVTVHADAFHCLTRVKVFVTRVLKDDIPSFELPDRRGQPTKLWSNAFSYELNEEVLEFSLVAPVALVEKGRNVIPRAEWDF
jgi:glyoxylase-like metal-dependent hydrolase (beta-lactamase superfamily II)